MISDFPAAQGQKFRPRLILIVAVLLWLVLAEIWWSNHRPSVANPRQQRFLH
jgi:hypothetical protein